MTTTAEERGNSLADWLLDSGRVPIITHDTRAKITQALRQAENDKLEEARQRVLEGHDEAWGNPAEQQGWDQAAQRIEALKSKD